MKELYERLVEGDPKAQAEIYKKFKNGYWRFLLHKYGDLSHGFLEESLQDGFLKIFKNVHQLQNPEKLREWGIAVLNNTVKSRIKVEYKMKVRGEYVDKPKTTDILNYVDTGYRQPIEHSLDLQLIPNFLSAVKMVDRTRDVLNLALQGYSHKDVADKLGITRIIATNHFHAGLRKIIKHKSLNSKI